jgi:predicted transcriptional regulator
MVSTIAQSSFNSKKPIEIKDATEQQEVVSVKSTAKKDDIAQPDDAHSFDNISPELRRHLIDGAKNDMTKGKIEEAIRAEWRLDEQYFKVGVDGERDPADLVDVSDLERNE